MNQTSYELVRQGVSLALEAHRRGLLDDRVLDAILQYYDAEGAVEPFPPAEVLERLGGLTAAQVRELLGAPARTPSDVQGQRFGDRLTLLEPLGAGGMGMVYRAYDRVLKRAVAVKRLRTDHLDKAGAGRVLARFEREAMAMARVRHPACVQIFDAGLTPAGEPYLVMELVTGRSLREVIEDDRARAGLEARRVAQWGAALADALQACHDVGLIHRDVKPANILLDAAGNPRLTDFGVALDDQARTRLTADRGMVGTLAYMSPEQAMCGAVDARSDVYALGATLYEVLTGSPPFDGPGAAFLLRQVLSEEPAPVRRRSPATPADLETIVHTCLAKSVADRYATAQALA
ncbi:MAG: serine/threonine protein kinase, partial [Planctomycetota bacterium]|nr:serine/threonine protein kinase [Planctomycetota bacterium]